jgi:hypothetical protein
MFSLLPNFSFVANAVCSGFDRADIWGHRAAEPNKAVVCSIALARLRTDIRGESASNNNAVGMAQKLLLFWRKPARRCWWEGVELEDVEGVPGTLKVWIRRVWTLEMVSGHDRNVLITYNLLTGAHRASSACARDDNPIDIHHQHHH